MEVISEEEPAGQRTWERHFQAERTINDAKALKQKQACSGHKDKNEQHTNKIRELGRKWIKRSFAGFNKVYEFYSKCDGKQVESF